VFTPSGLAGEVESGTTVLDAARALGVDIDSVCGGRGICGRCQVASAAGAFSKWGITVTAEALSSVGPVELAYTGKRSIGPGHRLGCAATICGDVVVDVPPDSQIHKQVIRKEVNLEAIELDPVVELRYIELARAELGDDATAADLVADGLARDWGIESIRLDPSLLPQLHGAIEAGGSTVTVAIRPTGNDAPLLVTGIWPGFVDTALGVAIDVGSTTIAGHLCDLASGEVLATAGRMNPQIRFGEDLMSRVSYVMMNPGGEVELTRVVREAIDQLIGELVLDAGLTRDLVLAITLVGNPIMHHLVLGIDPTPLGAAPFLLATSDAVELPARDLDLDAGNGQVYLAPCIAGHVGADTAAAINAEGPHRSDAIQLLVDVGTNAEIVLGNRHHLLAASSPTGPAFEGAQISCGVRASAGAIERIRIDRETLEPRYTIIGSDLWSDDPGFETAANTLGIIGLCGSAIIEVIGEMFLTGIIDSEGAIRGEFADPDHPRHTPRIVADERTFSYLVAEATVSSPEIKVTQNDVRAVQLAKAALRAGIDLLMERGEITRIDDVRLAGAFGAHIDPLYALVLGLVPDVPLDTIVPSGNAAGTGAVRMLLSGAERRETEAVVTRVDKIETATEPRFQELFVNAMAFPHRTAESPHLASLVDLPVRASAVGGRRRQRDRAARNGAAPPPGAPALTDQSDERLGDPT
jgi:uncharacterized 2Fe-2S/4Fe-4S cluster protein (DUF4445 family)